MSNDNSLSTLKEVGKFTLGLGVVAAVVAAPVTIGIAIFDRSRSITDSVVIAAGIFFCLLTVWEVGSKLSKVSFSNSPTPHQGC